MQDLSFEGKSFNHSFQKISSNESRSKQKHNVTLIQLPQETDEDLFISVIKTKSQQKQMKCKKIFEMSYEQLEDFFVNYTFFEALNLNFKQEIQNSTVRLVKNNNRIYFGQIFDHKKHGKGISVYSDNRIYQGQFLYNQKHGVGLQIYPNSNLYIGQYQKNKKHGTGTFYWFTLTTKHYKHQFIQYYKGQWWGGLPSGQGVHHRSNGDYYIGKFRNGLKHGQGIEYFINKDVYKGHYLNGLPQGYGEYTWQDESNYKGDFKQGLRSGFGIWKKNNSKDSEFYQGEYLLDKKCGYGVYTWQNGEYYKGQFFNDYRHGYGELFYRNELIYQGIWQNGKKIPMEKVSQHKKNEIREYFFKNKANFNLQQKLEQQFKNSFDPNKTRLYEDAEMSNIRNNMNNLSLNDNHYQNYRNDQYNQNYQKNYNNQNSQNNQTHQHNQNNQNYQNSHQNNQNYQNNRNNQDPQNNHNQHNHSHEHQNYNSHNSQNHNNSNKNRFLEKKVERLRSTSRRKEQYEFNASRLHSSEKKQRVGHRNCIPCQMKEQNTNRSRSGSKKK